MKIVFASHSAAPSGAELAMMECVRRSPADVTPVLLFGGRGPLHDEARRDGFQVHLYADRSSSAISVSALQQLRLGLDSLAGVRSARAWLRSASPDAVVCNNLRTGMTVGLAARSLSIPVIWHVRDRLTREYLGFALQVMAQIGSKVIPDALIYNSYSTRATLRYGLEKPHIVAYSPVATRDRLAGDLDPPWTAVHVGRITPWKGQHIFLAAFADAFPTGDERALIVGAPLFGEDDYLKNLQRLVFELGIQNRVRFLGHRTDVPDLLAEKTSVLVHSSTLPEPFGQVVAQGLATGLPVIASASGGPAELIRHEENGLLTRPSDVPALSAALRRLRHDRLFAEDLASSAYAAAVDLRDIDSSVRRIFDFIRDVLGQGHGAR